MTRAKRVVAKKLAAPILGSGIEAGFARKTQKTARLDIFLTS